MSRPAPVSAYNSLEAFRLHYSWQVPGYHTGTTIAFFTTEHITVCLPQLFQLADLLADKLKAGQHVDGTQSVMGGNLLAHIHGNLDLLYKCSVDLVRNIPDSKWIQSHYFFEVCNVTSSTYLPHTGNSWFDGDSGSVMQFIFL